MAQAAPLEVRNLRFDTGTRVPRYWNGNRASITTFFNNLSVFFPAGETFFIASVRSHLGAVRDERLLREVKAFCLQEGTHSREHRRYNRMLREQGYPVDAMDRRVVRLLGAVTALTPRRWQLSATCALEHFTALMGQLLLEDPRLLDRAHPVMASLWRWHAIEENEHKAIAFEVYRAAGGNAPERAFIMLATTLIFWVKVVEQQIGLMAADGTLARPDEWSALLGWLLVDPGWMRRMLPLYLAYYRPGFHPWDVDTRDLLERWLGELSTVAPQAAS